MADLASTPTTSTTTSLLTTSSISFSVFGNPIVPITPDITTTKAEPIYSKDELIVPLEWHAGYQPILLNLGEEKWIKHLNWISLYDHNKKVFVFKN